MRGDGAPRRGTSRGRGRCSWCCPSCAVLCAPEARLSLPSRRGSTTYQRNEPRTPPRRLLRQHDGRRGRPACRRGALSPQHDARGRGDPAGGQRAAAELHERGENLASAQQGPDEPRAGCTAAAVGVPRHGPLSPNPHPALSPFGRRMCSRACGAALPWKPCRPSCGHPRGSSRRRPPSGSGRGTVMYQPTRHLPAATKSLGDKRLASRPSPQPQRGRPRRRQPSSSRPCKRRRRSRRRQRSRRQRRRSRRPHKRSSSSSSRAACCRSTACAWTRSSAGTPSTSPPSTASRRRVGRSLFTPRNQAQCASAGQGQHCRWLGPAHFMTLLLLSFLLPSL